MRDHIVLDVFRSQVSLECGSYGHDGPPLRLTSPASLALTAPGEERSREICRIAVTLRRAGLFLRRIRIWLQHLPIKMPGGMTEHRQNDSETDEERYRTDHQQCRNNQPPHGHGKWIFHHNPQRRPDCVYRSRMQVEHQRKRHNTDAERHDGEQETDAAADDNERPSFWCRQHARCEIRDACSRSIAEGRNVDSVRGGDPNYEQNEQERAEFEHGAERRCAQHVHGIPRSGFLAALAAAAEFVETERGKRTNQRKTGGQRKEQRQHRMAKDHSEQNKAEYGKPGTTKKQLRRTKPVATAGESSAIEAK